MAQDMKAIQALADKVGWFYIIVTTGCFAGYAPFDPGTAGTIVAIPLYLLLVQTGWLCYGLMLPVLFVIGMQGAKKIEIATQQIDHGMIVIDEIVGYLVTMVFLPRQWLYIILGFVLFRVLDSVKPYPIRKFDKNPRLGGFGVMFDDVLAGLYVNLFLQLIVGGKRLLLK